MTPEERKVLDEIHRALSGNNFAGVPGLIKDVKALSDEVRSIKEQFKKGRFIVYGLGIGFAAGGLIFGFVSGKALLEWIQKIFL